MPQVALEIGTRRILQIGTSVGSGNWLVEDVTDDLYNQLLIPLSGPNGGVVLNADHTFITSPPPPPPPPPPDLTNLRNAIVSQAQSAVGVTLNNLTATQRLALVACMLYSIGGLDPVTLAVKPLNQWVFDPRR